MLSPFFHLAVVSPGRQAAFRTAVVAHVLLTGAAAVAVAGILPASPVPVLGHVLLIAGIVEGATLLGWRLAQLPKSQALEFLLASQLRPFNVFLAEALVGLSRLALVTLSGLPILALLVVAGILDPLTLILVLVMPFTWGAVTGLTLVVWAYEPTGVRRWGERVLFLLIVLALVVGVLAGEHLKAWLHWLPWGLDDWFLAGFLGVHRRNPFAVLGDWLCYDTFSISWEWTLALEAVALVTCALLILRAGCRLQGHFHELHYQPATDRRGKRRPVIGDRPLSWWALQRVTRYPGRSNLWLAGGFGLLYALFTLAGPAWPAWLGRQVFQTFEQVGGIPVVATALVVLAAVPAAFQYGLWDHSAQDRCRRLELLLLTRLGGRDYWEAAASAAWKRGRGYFLVAVMLWSAAVLGGKACVFQALAALAAGVMLWGLYFAVGFRAFATGAQANGLGAMLTLGLPLVAVVLYRAGPTWLASVAPPGGVFVAMASGPSIGWLPGPLLAAGLTLVLTRRTLARCDEQLRQWYDLNHGQKVMS